MLVKAQRVLVARPRVAGNRIVVLRDQSDESLADALAAKLGRDGEKEDVAVASNRREPHQSLVAPVPAQQEINRRAPVGVGEKALSLFEHVLFVADALFELPRRLGVAVVAGASDFGIDVDAH